MECIVVDEEALGGVGQHYHASFHIAAQISCLYLAPYTLSLCLAASQLAVEMFP